ncbi:MBL fold metallo-hydrolase [Chengkuizengella sp. SCS-71B]|uniref:MBL fold metallo-hydrolase n=1 Tax=Chengkuizengella sp. SCS-71B TaxID=3115290 RepID=UPI0032C22AB9
MEIRQVTSNFMEYKFIYKEKQICNYLYLLLDGQDALIIDTGYKEDMKRLLEFLNEKEIEIKRVVLSHYHNDHFEGLKLLKDVEIIGSKQYTHAIDQYYLKDSINDEKYFPDLFIEEVESIKHGNFELKFINSPGHSKCSISTIINDEYIHVADNIMHSHQGIPHLPLPYYSFSSHIKSLQQLKNNSSYKIISSHSNEDQCKNIIENGEVDARIKYMETVMTSKRELTFEELISDLASNNFHIQFHSKWYKHVYDLFHELKK